MKPKRKMQIPEITKQQWDDRDKAMIFQLLRRYFAYRAVFGESLFTYNADFFTNAIKILEDELWGRKQ